MLLARANKLLAASFRDFLDVFFPHPTNYMAAFCWDVWKVVCAFWMQERDREESGGRIRSQTLGFWLEMRKSEALCLRSDSLGSRA